MSESEELDKLAKKVEEIYADNYRQQYSDLLRMMIEIEDSDENYDAELLGLNLESLTEYIRTHDKYSDDTYYRMTKLTDHIALEVQRLRDYESIVRNMVNKNIELKKNIEKLNKDVDEARTSIQRYHMEMVAILGVFSAIVVAFSGGMDFLGGTMAISGDSDIFRVVFVVLLCGMVLFNIIAFLMHMILSIIRLHDPERDYDDSNDGLPKMVRIGRYLDRFIGSRFIIIFNVILIISMLIDVICMIYA